MAITGRSTRTNVARPAICTGLPNLDAHVITRSRLEERLAVGSSGALTVVEAPSGSGKTLGVARWSADQTAASGVVWLDASGVSHHGQRFWSDIRSGLIAVGAGSLPPDPLPEDPEASWCEWLATLTDALDLDGRTWVLVLDDFPAGSGPLGPQLVDVLQRTTTLRAVLTCTTWSAADLPSLALLGDYTHIGPDALRLDDREIGAMLAAGGATADSAVIAQISERTQGWALGVAVAARLMARGPSGNGVMLNLDGMLDDLLDREVLERLPAAARELVMRSSLTAVVPADLGRTMVGSDEPLPMGWVAGSRGFVEVGPAGSFRCHPLLRHSALRRLTRDWPAMARESRRIAATWFVEHGDRSIGIDLASQGGDWRWVARIMVSSLAVPSIILGAADAAGAELHPEVGATEPLLAAAVAAAAGRPQEAEAALARAGAGDDRSRGLAHRLSEAVIRMAVARQRLDHEAGLHWVAEGRRLAAELTRDQQRLAPELPSLLNAHEGAFLLYAGEFDRAVDAVERTARGTTRSDAEQIAAAECAGLLAWVEALRGNLTCAARHAAGVLTTRPADGDEVGVGYAQIAVVWVHLERRELDQARQRLAHAARVGHQDREPWLAAMRRLAEARVTAANGEPDIAVRLLSTLRRSGLVAEVGWLADRTAVALAEAHLAAGDPQRALATLTPEPKRTVVEARVLAAAARRAIGDKRGARGLLTAIEGLVAEAPLPAAVQVWGLQAQLASDVGEIERAASLADRALRAASREDLRTALTLVMPWLPAFVERHPDLCRPHRSLVASLGSRAPQGQITEPAAVAGLGLETLTERELQVLERLGQLATTDEIANDLFVSANTVKTHIKSLFIKLAVNRRADAVRRGRALGLC